MSDKKEYISREAALKVVCAYCTEYSGDDPNFCCDCMDKLEMMNIPVADVVEVVRCKDCRFYNPSPEEPSIMICEWDKLYRNPDGYCDYGKKRAEWILSEDGYYVCSECGKVCPYDVNEGGTWYWTCHYCPCCGLEMNESVILNG